MVKFNGNIQGWLRIIIGLLLAVAGTVAFAFTTFETSSDHNADMVQVEQIHKDLHELLEKFGSAPTHLTK